MRRWGFCFYQRKNYEKQEQIQIIIFDTTLRNGEQCPGASMNLREKLEIARQLARLNVDVIEAGFPILSATAILPPSRPSPGKSKGR